MPNEEAPSDLVIAFLKGNISGDFAPRPGETGYIPKDVESPTELLQEEEAPNSSNLPEA